MQHPLRLQGQTYARVEKERADQYAQPVLRPCGNCGGESGVREKAQDGTRREGLRGQTGLTLSGSDLLGRVSASQQLGARSFAPCP